MPLQATQGRRRCFPSSSDALLTPWSPLPALYSKETKRKQTTGCYKKKGDRSKKRKEEVAAEVRSKKKAAAIW
jgi:hypothetical protein